MPYVTKRSVKSVIPLATACLALLAVSQPAFAASTLCTTPGTASAVFAPFGDASSYIAVPGGSFESNQTQKWTMTKTSVVAGNEPFYVNSTKDTQSLSMSAGGTAKSPAVCVDATRPWWRFVATSHSGGTSSTLNVWAQWVDGAGAVQKTPVTTLPAGSYQSWAVSPQLVLGSAIGTGASVNANLYFSATGKWQIDDVYVDPYAK